MRDGGGLGEKKCFFSDFYLKINLIYHKERKKEGRKKTKEEKKEKWNNIFFIDLFFFYSFVSVWGGGRFIVSFDKRENRQKE